jgi:hypothetical protein
MTCENLTDRWDEQEDFADREFGDAVFAYTYDGFDILVENQTNKAFRVDEDDRLRALFRAIAKALAVGDSHTEKSYRDRFIDCASDEALDELAKPVDIKRRTDEDDEKFRTRVKAGYGRAASETTLRDFATIALNVLQTSAGEVNIRGTTDDKPVVVVDTDVSVVDDALFTRSEIVDLLNDAVASAHNVEIQTTGTFEFDGDNYSPSSNTGFGDGTFGGQLN